MRLVVTILLFTIHLIAGIGGGKSSVGPIPVELTSFSAIRTENSVILKWATATETNNFGFEIQRASFRQNETTPLEWKTIGFVNGNGTTAEPNEYSFEDKSILNSDMNIYYRLKQIDFDGKNNFSEVLKVSKNIIPFVFNLNQNYPNPFNLLG